MHFSSKAISSFFSASESAGKQRFPARICTMMVQIMAAFPHQQNHRIIQRLLLRLLCRRPKMRLPPRAPQLIRRTMIFTLRAHHFLIFCLFHMTHLSQYKSAISFTHVSIPRTPLSSAM